MPRHPIVTAIATLALVGTAAATATPATAAPETARPTVASNLVSPLSFALKPNGTAYISQNFAGVLTRKAPGRKARAIFQARPGVEVGAVSVRKGRVSFAITRPSGQTALKVMGRHGRVRTVADLDAFERRHNPDGARQYGFVDIPDDCASQLPAEIGPPTYTGIVESHPYASTMTPKATYLADAAGNSILRIGRAGRVSTVAILPQVRVTVTAAAAENLGLPECVVGLDYRFEPVPTDVERRRGALYVTSLPGGPEDPSLGANGSVFRVSLKSGRVTKVAGGLLSAVNLAVARDGDLFVAELFGNSISRIAAGRHTARPYKKATMPGALEWGRRGLYATVNVLAEPPAGRLVRFRR